MENPLPSPSTVITPVVSDIDPAPNIPDSPVTAEERVSGAFAQLVLMRAERKRMEDERAKMKEEYKLFMRNLKKKECKFKRDSASPYEVPSSQKTADGVCRGHDVNTSKIAATDYEIPKPGTAPVTPVTGQASSFIPSSNQTTPLSYVTIDACSLVETPAPQTSDIKEEKEEVKEGDVSDVSSVSEEDDDDIKSIGDYMEEETPTKPKFQTDSEWATVVLEEESRRKAEWEEEERFMREEEERGRKVEAQFESIQSCIDALKNTEKGKGREIDPLTVTPPNKDLEEVYDGEH